MGLDLSKTGFVDAMAYTSDGTELTKMFVASPLYTNQDKQQLGDLYLFFYNF